MIEKFTEHELAVMDTYRRIHTREEYTHSNDFVPMTDILKLYDTNKTILYKMLGEQFIVEKEFIAEKGENEIRRTMSNEKINGKLAPFIRHFKQVISDNYDKMRLIEPNYDINVYQKLYYQTFDDEPLTKNKVYYDVKFTGLNGKPVIIIRGMKLMKAVGKLVDAFGMDQQLFEEFRIAHSQVLNDKKIKGTLCLSIHPFDYMTMSDNDCDWDSCMSWRDKGCYRRGTVEMMNSPSVVVAYVKSDRDMKVFSKWSNIDNPEVKEATWNNKKWRELFVCDGAIITGIKAYPYANKEIEAEVIKWLRELAHQNLGRDYSDNIYEYKIGCDLVFPADEANAALNIKENGIFNPQFYTVAMYNDFGLTSGGKHYGVLNLANVDDPIHYKHYYSGPATCMCCGRDDKHHNLFGCEGNLLCEDCGIPSATCDCCGYSGNEEDFHYVGDSLICQACYEDETFYDRLTEEDYWNDDGVSIGLSLAADRFVDSVEALSDEEKALWKQAREFIHTPDNLPDWYNSIAYAELRTLDNVWELRPRLWSQYFKVDPTHKQEYGDYWVSIYDLVDRPWDNGALELFDLLGEQSRMIQKYLELVKESKESKQDE